MAHHKTQLSSNNNSDGDVPSTKVLNIPQVRAPQHWSNAPQWAWQVNRGNPTGTPDTQEYFDLSDGSDNDSLPSNPNNPPDTSSNPPIATTSNPHGPPPTHPPGSQGTTNWCAANDINHFFQQGNKGHSQTSTICLLGMCTIPVYGYDCLLYGWSMGMTCKQYWPYWDNVEVQSGWLWVFLWPSMGSMTINRIKCLISNIYLIRTPQFKNQQYP